MANRERLRGVRLLLGLWVATLISYFAPWIARRPYSAALAWNAYDLFDLMRLLPEVEAGTLQVNLQSLHLPLLGLALLLPLIVGSAPRGTRVLAGLLSAGLALATLPPYPEILTAWYTSGWRVPFWWGILTAAASLGLAWYAPRPATLRAWLILGIGLLTALPAWPTLHRLLPPLSRLHNTAVTPGWGFWGTEGGLLITAGAAWVLNVAWVARGPRKERTMGGRNLSHVQEVKARYEQELLHKANVLSVGIGVGVDDDVLEQPTPYTIAAEEAEEGEPARTGIVVSVTHKVPEHRLRQQDRIPEELEGVPVWVREVGELTPRAAPATPSTAEEEKPTDT